MDHQLIFHNTQFNIITCNNHIWLTALKITQALKYINKNAINRIYVRNTEEFIAGMIEKIKFSKIKTTSNALGPSRLLLCPKKKPPTQQTKSLELKGRELYEVAGLPPRIG